MTPAGSDFLFYSTVDDDLYSELVELVGEAVVHVALWEDSLVDALAAQGSEEAAAADPGAPATFDMDLYLEGGVYFELYSVTAYPDPDSDPFTDRGALEQKLHALMKTRLSLGEVAVDDEDALVLVLVGRDGPAVYLAVGGWVLEEWDELPV